MPPRRRARASAAKLHTSRLPLGTHLPATLPRPDSRTTDRSISRASQHPPSPEPDFISDIDKIVSSPSGSQSATTSLDMSASAQSTAGANTASRAAAKLRRQNERIQQAEAALSAPPPGERSRERPQSRGKGKPTYNQMGITWDIGQQPPGSEGGLPVAQVRVNTYAPAPNSRDTSSSRSISSLSVATGARDMSRMDSMFDEAGFQTYARGRRGKAAEELSAYEVKPEEKQTSVEANFDQQEIRKVFAQQLPGLDFIQQQAGFRDHQLQFLQHPNGDVSAHMWNSAMYQWENIGNFSNIRKRVEGQLANDRLKGETGWQTLQKHTLAYFRAIAKQREQLRMGLPFGQDQIQALLPQPLERKSFVPNATTTSTALPAPNTAQTYGDTNKAGISASLIRQSPRLNPRAGAYAHPLQQGVRQSRLDQFQSTSAQEKHGRVDDPFTSASAYPSAYYTAFAPPSAAPTGHSTAHTSLFNTGTACGASADAAGAPGDAPSFQLFTAKPQDQATPPHQRLIGDQQQSSTKQRPLFAPASTPQDDAASRGQASFASSKTGAPTQPKAVTPLRTREAMRDHLLRLGETAKERSLSQNNIRTVMHDPYKKQSDSSDDLTTQSAKRISPSLFRTGHADNVELPPKPQYKSTSSIGGGIFAWQNSHPASKASLRRETSLGDSVPDTEYPYGTSQDMSMTNPSSYPYHALACQMETVDAESMKKKGYEQELSDWWTSGNKFARQEEFFQRIMAPHRKRSLVDSSVPDDSTTTSSNPPRPIGAPPASATPLTPSVRSRAQASKTSAAKEEAPINEDMTRILIPVYENLASYVEGPLHKRRDYWSNWSQPPEWCIDRSANGNNSFYDATWGQPPARVGRDPRYRALPGELQFGGLSPHYHHGGARLSLGGSGAGLSGGIPGLSGRYFGGGVAGRY